MRRTPESFEEFCKRNRADEPMPPAVWARVKAIFEAPIYEQPAAAGDGAA